MRRLCLPFFLFLVHGLAAQSTVLDGAYIKEHALTKRVVPYTSLREADVMWTKRVWRIIDLHEKINHPLYYPITPIQNRKSLFDVIKKGVLEDGSITAYDPGVFKDDDEFTEPMTRNQLKNVLVSTDTVLVPSLDDDDSYEEKIQENPVVSEDIKQYKLKEDWFFDRQRSVMEVRIIGIAPMAEVHNESGDFLGYAELFWLYYPECRYVFVHEVAFNRFNGAERLSYEDLFQKRMFNSYIVEEENVYDRAIVNYKTGIDALLESDRIKNHLFGTEHDLWSF